MEELSKNKDYLSIDNFKYNPDVSARLNLKKIQKTYFCRLSALEHARNAKLTLTNFEFVLTV